MEEKMLIVSENQIQEMANSMMQTISALGDVRDIANLLRITNERIKALEDEVKRLTKVTPAQASALNRLIREHAALICEKHRATGCEKMIGTAIRKAIKNTCGISSIRELPRCDYSVAIRQVEIWDDYRQVLEIKRRVMKTD